MQLGRATAFITPLSPMFRMTVMLLAYRELDGALRLTDLAASMLSYARRGRNTRHMLAGLLGQSVFGRLARHEDVSNARSACIATRAVVIAACCASASARRAALSECSRHASKTSTPTMSRNSVRERVSSNAASGSNVALLNHAADLSATSLPRDFALVTRLRAEHANSVVGSGRRAFHRQNDAVYLGIWGMWLKEEQEYITPSRLNQSTGHRNAPDRVHKTSNVF